jgi:hypothetical protein
MDKLIAISAVSLALALVYSPATAQTLRVRLDLGADYNWAQSDSLDAALGFAERYSADATLRFMLDGSEGPWRYEVHSQLAFDIGDNVAFDAALAGMFPPAPPPVFFDLTTNIVDDGNVRLTNTIDRLALTYTADDFVVRVGRQALTWGAGLVFRPGDIVAPFSPNATDTSYKPGVDMLYGQYLFENGGDLEAVFVPRRAVAGGPFDWNSSTLALRSTMLLGDLDGTIMIARDRGDTLLDVSLSGPLGGAAWNAEIGQWLLDDGSFTTNFVANISSSGTLAGFDIFYFAEYFHNGFGVASGTALDALPANLSSRLSTGQLFNTGRDFVALGGQVSLTPDLSVSPGVIASLNDASIFTSVQAQLSLSDETDLIFSAGTGFGPLGSEFGGQETTAGSGVYVRAPVSVSVKLSSYF